MALVRLIGQADIENALKNAFKQWVKEDIDEAFWDDQFKEDKWLHGPLTIRRNGQVVGNPRDIYDLGNLYESGKESKISVTLSSIQADWHWDALNASEEQYAWYVHYGKGTNFPYARPFTDDLSIAFSFRKPIGMALQSRVTKAFGLLHGN
jgi:hypothetical protein